LVAIFNVLRSESMNSGANPIRISKLSATFYLLCLMGMVLSALSQVPVQEDRRLRNLNAESITRLTSTSAFVVQATGDSNLSPLVGVTSTSVLSPVSAMIHPRSGGLSLNAIDLDVPAGAVSIEWSRTLQTRPVLQGLLGSLWRTNWESRVVLSDSMAMLEDLNGVMQFKFDAETNRYFASNGEQIILNEDKVQFVRADGSSDLFDSQGRLSQRFLRNGNFVTLTYDPDGRLQRLDGPYGSFLQLHLDGAGRVKTVESSTGQSLSYFYEGDESETLSKSPRGQGVRMEYDPAGQAVLIEHVGKLLTEFTYDDQERVVRQRFDGNVEESYVYEDENTIRHTAADGKVMRTKWSPDGRLQQTTDPQGRQSSVEYDEAGRPVAITGPAGKEIRMSYDSIGRVKTLVDENQDTTSFEYLGHSQLLAVTGRIVVAFLTELWL
jgi:YD repeat-containing protein